MLGCGWMVCSAEDGLGVVSGSLDAEGLFRRCPTRNPSIDEDTELLGHRSSYAAASHNEDGESQETAHPLPELRKNHSAATELCIVILFRSGLEETRREKGR